MKNGRTGSVQGCSQRVVPEASTWRRVRTPPPPHTPTLPCVGNFLVHMSEAIVSAPASDANRFATSTRAVLSAVFCAQELQELEAHLGTPNDALHLRTNAMQIDRKVLLERLQAEPSLEGYAIEVHPKLWDVLVIQRRPCAPELQPYLAITHILSTDRFAERKQRGLPPHEVFVDIVCGEAVLRGADIFVKGVFGASAGLESGNRVSVYADTRRTLLRGSVCESLEGMRLLGIGTCHIDRPALFREPSGLAVTMDHVISGDLPSMSGILNGLLYVQTLPSLTVAHVLDAQPGERILDMCAAPGSKTTHIATNFLRDADGSCVVACERNHGKIAKMAALCATLGAGCVQPTRADTTRLAKAGDALPTSGAKKGNKGGVPGLSCARESFDRVLLDPPCSAIGLRPRLVLESAGASCATIAQTAAYQRLFLWVAVQALKVGGTLVYSTCTLTADENEGQVARALEAYPCLELVSATPRLGSKGRAGLGLSDAQCELVQRFEPREGCEGFFIAKLQKVRGCDGGVVNAGGAPPSAPPLAPPPESVT